MIIENIIYLKLDDYWKLAKIIWGRKKEPEIFINKWFLSKNTEILESA